MAQVYSDLNFTNVKHIVPSFVSQIGAKTASALGIPVGGLLLLVTLVVSLVGSITRFGFARSFVAASFFSMILSVVIVKDELAPDITIVFTAIVFIISVLVLLSSKD